MRIRLTRGWLGCDGGGMAKARWLSPWKDSERHPPLYHVVSRVVERRFAFGREEKEKFRAFLRLAENFTGCRVLAYCVMSNHFHILLEVPPAPRDGVAEETVVARVAGLYGRARAKWLEAELAEWRQQGECGERQAQRLLEVHRHRMHDLSEFMKLLLQRFSQWFNREQERTGRLWEQRFKSVLVEGGLAARAVAAYIDLNPVRAGICEDAADYRWSSYGEAVAGGRKARAGLVRALHGWEDKGDAEATEEKGGKRVYVAGEERAWGLSVAREYREILLGKGTEVVADGLMKRKGMKIKRAEQEATEMAERGTDLGLARAVRQRVRYFTDGAVIGSRGFVDEVFRRCRERFGAKRKDGARKPRGALGAMAGVLWSARELRVRL